MKKKIKKYIPKIILKIFSNYRNQIKINSIKGNKVLCPICNSQFKIFGTFGLIKRNNALCYTCGSLERHRLLWKYLMEKTDLLKKQDKIRILHFAPEKNFYELFSENCDLEYIPCDLFPENYNFEKKIAIKRADITSISFDDNYFDVILCNHVLEHIPDDKLAMSELFRVMKKGGWGIFQVPIDYNRETTYEDFSLTTNEEREKAFGQSDHVRRYGRDYKMRLMNAGFEVLEDDYIKDFSPKEIFKYGLIPSELIYNCRK